MPGAIILVLVLISFPIIVEWPRYLLTFGPALVAVKAEMRALALDSLGLLEASQARYRTRDGADASMGGEDFSYMLEARPGAYLFLGTGPGAGLHHAAYDFNDEAAPIGASFFARLVERAQPLA